MRFYLCIPAMLLSFGLSLSASANPLTEDDIRGAQRIGLMPGTFDPVTDGHMAAAEAALQSGVDFIILVPQENPHKNPIPRPVRLKLIAAAADGHPKIMSVAEDSPLYAVFAKKRISSIASRIRKLNPKAKISLVAGSDFAENAVTDFLFQAVARPDDWVVVSRAGSESAKLSWIVRHRPHQEISMPPLDVSSSKIKAFLLSHPEIYANPSAGVAVAGLNPQVARMIAEQGLYREPPRLSAGRKLFECVLNIFWKK